jgi:hypothetical protein
LVIQTKIFETACRRKFRSQTSDILWTDAATVVGAVREEKGSEEKESGLACTRLSLPVRLVCGFFARRGPDAPWLRIEKDQQFVRPNCFAFQVTAPI